jgi:multiple sugar transport system permease protein
MIMKIKTNNNQQNIIAGISIIFLLVWLFPYLYLIFSSFKPKAEVVSIPPRFFPSVFSIENFTVLFGRLPVLQYIGNSLICAVASTIIAVILGSLSAYAIARSGNRVSMSLVILVLCLKMIPTSSIAVPIYEIITDFSLYDTKFALIIVYAAINMPFVIWTMMSFYEGIPTTLDEAACIDGANNLTTFRRIILPICAPGLATSGIFTLFLAWNDFLLALLLTSMKAKTFTVGLSEFLSAYSMDLGPMCAGALLFSFPVMVLSMAAQKYIIRGMTAGAVKG